MSAGSVSGFSVHTAPASVTEKHNARRGPVLTMSGIHCHLSGSVGSGLSLHADTVCRPVQFCFHGPAQI